MVQHPVHCYVTINLPLKVYRHTLPNWKQHECFLVEQIQNSGLKCLVSLSKNLGLWRSFFVVWTPLSSSEGEVTLYSRNRDSLSFEVQDLSLPRFNVNHYCFLGTDQMASWSEGLLMFCSVLCLVYLWRSVLTGLCSPRRDRQPEQQPRRPAGQRWAHLQLGAQPPGRDVQRLGSFFAPLYCFVFVSSMSIWHSLTCIGYIYQFQNLCFFSYDLYTSINNRCMCVWQESLALWPLTSPLLWTWRLKIKKRMTWTITNPQTTSNQTTRVIKGIWNRIGEALDQGKATVHQSTPSKSVLQHFSIDLRDSEHSDKLVSLNISIEHHLDLLFTPEVLLRNAWRF